MKGFKLSGLWILFWLSCWVPPLQSQSAGVSDTVWTTSTVEVRAAKIRQQQAGGMNQTWTVKDLDQLAVNTLADLLTAETGTFVKSYGQGSLATTSIRGGSAGHTLVLWNGLPVESPMLGQLDLALLPAQTTESVGLMRGGNTALWGSGAIGGILSLDNQANFSQRWAAQSQTQIGSFGQLQQQLKISLGNARWQSVTRIAHQEADNDFTYFLADGLPERKQTNARVSQQYLLQDFYWKLDQRRRLAVHFWRQQSDRQIPPTNAQTRSEAHQDDLATRLILDFRQVGDHGFWQVKTGFYEEHLDYYDDLINLESLSHFRTYLGEISGEWQWKKRHRFLAGNTHTHIRAWSPGYQENTPSEYKTAFFVSWVYNSSRWTSQVSLRQEVVDGDRIPLVPAIGIDYQISDQLKLKAKISRNYRLPTFNDRFWRPGGNPDLVPESGWSQELSLVQNFQKGALSLDASLTAFTRVIDDWIMWSINDGQAFWSANNITKVWSRGLEPRINLTYKKNNWQIQWRSGYDYIRSTNQVALEQPRMAAGAQLLYTPMHQVFSTLAVNWQSWHLAYQHRFTGETQGINGPVADYQVGQLRFQYTGAIQSFKGTLFLNLNNIWDTDYLVIERRPMPGRHFQLGLRMAFAKNSVEE